jgi:NADPH:quinone reductase-like Zn-dependent oxidoreductase
MTHAALLLSCQRPRLRTKGRLIRAFTLDGFGAAPALRDDLPEPRVGENQLLVHVRDSSVNPVDAFIAAGGLEEMAEHEFPVTLGRDFAGVVEQVGSGTSRYQVCGPGRFNIMAQPTPGNLQRLGELPRDRRAPGSEPAQLPARASG